MTTLRALCERYSRFSVADSAHNEEILDFLRRVSMSTKRGSLSARRGPDFFALGRAQGEKSFTILMRNNDGSLGGIAALSVSTAIVKGRPRPLVYASDLRLAPNLSRKTRLQFYDWYSELARACAEIEEFGGSPYMITSVFEENTAAMRALVERRREPLYRPVFAYQNINVLGRRPGRLKFTAESCADPLALKSFLLANPEGGEIVWSIEEIERKLAILGLGFQDFLVVREGNHILGAALPFSDFAFRQPVLQNLGPGLRLTGRLLPLLGKPGFREGTPLKTGFLGFLKIQSRDSSVRAEIVAALLAGYMRRERRLPRRMRCHTITVMEARGHGLEKKLRRRGFFVTLLPATLYQVVHRDNYQREKLLRANNSKRPDFEVGLA